MRAIGGRAAFTDVSSGDRVVDVACGMGALSKALAKAGSHVIGIDASKGLHLEGALRHRSHPNVTFEGGDMRQMRFADDSSDAAVSTLALDALPEMQVRTVPSATGGFLLKELAASCGAQGGSASAHAPQRIGQGAG